MSKRGTTRVRVIVAAALAASTIAGLGVDAYSSASAIEARERATSSSSVLPVRLGPPAPASFADLAEQVRPAVVYISTEQVQGNGAQPGRRGIPPGMLPFPSLREHFGQRRVGGVGSGFVVDAQGYIVTNHHVVDGADTIKVTLDDGSEHSAALVGADPKTDLAVLRIEAGRPLPSVRFGDSDGTRVGDWVVAVGNPFGLGGSVSAGIVSARGRDIRSGPYDDFLQFDAPINRGNSGGPLFDTQGQVVGVNTAIVSPSGGNVGIGFAVPASTAKPVVDQLIDSGQVARGWAGIRIQSLTPALARGLDAPDAEGALVVGVSADGPADRAGIQRGDIVRKVEGEAVSDVNALVRRIGAFRPGTKVAMELWREGGVHELALTLANTPGTPSLAKGDARPSTSASGPRLGVQLSDLDPHSRRSWRVAEGTAGALVVAVDRDSPAAQADLRPGDVILSVDRAQVSGAAAAAEAIGAHRSGAGASRPLLLLVERQGHQRYVAVEIG